MYGHLASGFVINYIHMFMNHLDFLKEINNFKDKDNLPPKNDIKEKIIYENLVDTNYRLLKTCFIKTEYELTQANFDVNFSGTTAVFLIMIGIINK